VTKTLDGLRKRTQPAPATEMTDLVLAADFD
jgi:hypothetical protein